MSLTLKLLRAYLNLGIEPDPEEETRTAEEIAAADAEAARAAAEELPDLEEEDPPEEELEEEDPVKLRAQLKAEKTARETAERTARESADRAAAADRARTQAAAGPTDEQKLFEKEEADLANPATSEMRRWQINADRTLRSNTRAAQDALFSSRDMADRTAFESLCASKPVFKKYASRVEEKIEVFRKQGQLVPRAIALRLLLGDDMVEGRMKTKTKPATTAGAQQQQTQQQQRVDRGRTATARSDVRRGAGANSESAKRRARLDGQII